MSNLTACSDEQSMPLDAQISGMGGLSNVLPQHVSTSYHCVLGYAHAICLKRRHSPHTGMCFHPKRNLIAQFDTHMQS